MRYPRPHRPWHERHRNRDELDVRRARFLTDSSCRLGPRRIQIAVVTTAPLPHAANRCERLSNLRFEGSPLCR